MNTLMTAMFWGGVVMAATPVAVGVFFMVYMYRRHQEDERRATPRAVHEKWTEGGRIEPAADE